MATDGPYEAQRDADITLLYHLPGASTKGTHAVPVGDVEVVIAATAKYMAAMGAGANPRPVRRLSDNLTDGFWAAADFRGQTPPASDADLRFAHIATALEACLSGHGAMAVDRRMIESELLDGRLTVVGPRFTFKESVVAACKASGTGDVERQEFLKWLRLALAAPHDPPTAATPPPKTETMRSAPLFKTTNYIGNRK
jgi:DNA-binding transcriptional LysR family regulator